MENVITYQTAKHSHTKLYPRSLIVVIILFSLIYTDLFSKGGYVDEAVGLLSYAVLAFYWAKIKTEDLITLGLLGGVTLLGLIANVVFDINTSIFSILIDVLAQTKLIVTFYAVHLFLNQKEKKAVLDILLPIAQAYILAAAFFALISQVADIGMATDQRYGFPVYHFIFSFNHHYTTVSFLMFGVILFSNRLSAIHKRFFCIVGLLAILAAVKSPAIMFSAIFLFLTFYFRRYNKISIGIILPMAAAIYFLGSYQIDEYFRSSDAPRRLFLQYSIVDANAHFPLGSGFGTFGSAEAAKHYSPLYYEYGFNNRWGLSPSYGMFLYDTYWPAILGQFGWVGFVGYISVYARMFLRINKTKTTAPEKAFLYAVFFQYMIHAIGAAILSTSTGLIGIIGLALFSEPDPELEKKKKRHKIKITF